MILATSAMVQVCPTLVQYICIQILHQTYLYTLGCYVCRYDAEFEKSYLQKMRMKVEQHCYVHVC